ncbi:hypothetical protein BDR22DRAFT_890323 [Usnea florida]
MAPTDDPSSSQTEEEITIMMEPTDNPSYRKTEQEASKKSSETREDNDTDRRSEEKESPEDDIQRYKEEIRYQSILSLSVSIQLGKARGAEAKDLDLIRQLKTEYEKIQVQITKDKEVIKKLEQEIERQENEKHEKLLSSLTDALPSPPAVHRDG